LDQDSTIIAVVELSQSSWLVAGVLPGIERQLCKKLEPSPERLLAVLHAPLAGFRRIVKSAVRGRWFSVHGGRFGEAITHPSIIVG
jgi:hypothetical protein